MSSSAQQKNTGGGHHEDIDPNDPYIQEIAKWAVDEHNSQKGTHLVYKKTLKAARECITGSTRYFIELEASEGCKTNKYYAQVLELVCQTPIRKLEVFEPRINAPIAVAN
ncbi:putative cysteine proteinase inhibitor 7 isoform X2 [Chenopodium quinoa]|uniref:putative cysteine proteinase inhibitor 7 isoform X2 n=1 Tax=Chenopodium quinoa TaxID=63459 RepID=UPI000B7954C1|nr:putative cysteine proteinase inhibitor 7 isoform X2 [Chenopodium quinoa]